MNSKSYYLKALFIGILILGGISGQSQNWKEFDIIDINTGVLAKNHTKNASGLFINTIEQIGLNYVFLKNYEAANEFGSNMSQHSANQKMFEIINQNPKKFKGILWAKPKESDPGLIEPFLTNKKYKNVFTGIALHPDLNNFSLSLPMVEGYFELCEKHTIPLIISLGSSKEANILVAIAKRHSTVPVIITPTNAKLDDKIQREILNSISWNKMPNLYLTTSLIPSKQIKDVISKLGSDRILFGSMGPFSEKNHYQKYEALIKEMADYLNEKDFYKIISGNAKSLFGL